MRRRERSPRAGSPGTETGWRSAASSSWTRPWQREGQEARHSCRINARAGRLIPVPPGLRGGLESIAALLLHSTATQRRIGKHMRQLCRLVLLVSLFALPAAAQSVEDFYRGRTIALTIGL